MRVTYFSIITFVLTSGIYPENKIHSVRHNTEGGKTRIVLEFPQKPDMEISYNPEGRTMQFLASNLRNPNSQLKDLENNQIIKKFYHFGKVGNREKYIFNLNENVNLKSFLLQPAEGFKHRVVIDLYHRNIARANQLLREAKQTEILSKPPIPIWENKVITEALPMELSNVSLNFTEETRPLPAYIFQKVCNYNKCKARSKPASIPVSYKPAIKKIVPKQPFIVAIDAGHGGKDPGAIGEGGGYEKDVVLAIAKKLAWAISREPDMKAVLIRNDDTYIDIRERVLKANLSGAKLFISIHANAAKNTSAYGSSVHVLSDRGKYGDVWNLLSMRNNTDLRLDPNLQEKLFSGKQQNAIFEITEKASHKLAGLILKNIEKINPLLTPHIYKSDFTVLKSWKVPSVLVETDFISNPSREKELISNKFQSELARSILAGIKEYYKQHISASSI